jgi:hypothetical protein
MSKEEKNKHLGPEFNDLDGLSDFTESHTWEIETPLFGPEDIILYSALLKSSAKEDLIFTPEELAYIYGRSKEKNQQRNEEC